MVKQMVKMKPKKDSKKEPKREAKNQKEDGTANSKPAVKEGDVKDEDHL